MNQRTKSERGYDRLAGFYRPLEWLLFGRNLQRSRVALLDRLPGFSQALVLGDGDGRLIEALSGKFPGGHLTSVDHSRAMLDRQRDRLRPAIDRGRVRLVQADATRFTPEFRRYDLMVTAYFLDCFSPAELAEHVPRWIKGLRPGGLLYFVDFVWPSDRWRRIQASAYQRWMHSLFRATTGLPNRTLVDLDAVLRDHDLQLVLTAENVHPLMTCRLYRHQRCPR